jgi:hypothetical protein
VAVGLALWMTWPAWGGRAPIRGIDVIAHVMRVTFGIEHLLAHGRLDGWFPGWFLGFQQYLVRGPGLTWLAALVRSASLGQLSVVAALNAAALGSFVVRPLGVAFLARAIGLEGRAAGLAAVISLVVDNTWGEGMSGLFGIGLLEQQPAAVLVFVGLGVLLRITADPRPRWVLVGAATLAALAITHVLSGLVMVLFAVFYLPGALRASPARGRALTGLALTAALTIGLVGFWLVPFLAHRDLRGPLASWGVTTLGERFWLVWRGAAVLRPRIAWAVLAGWLFAVVQAVRGRWLGLGLAAGPALYFVLTHLLASRMPGSEIPLQLPVRGIGYAGVLAVFPLAMLLAAVTRPLGMAGDALALGAASALVVVPIGPLRALAGPYPERPRRLAEAAAVLARVVPPGARFVTTQRFPVEMVVGTGLTTPDRWLSWRSARPSLNGLTSESANTSWVMWQGRELDSAQPELTAERLASLGVTHVVVASGPSVDRLVASPRFRFVWQASPVAILAVQPRPGQPPPSSLLSMPHPAHAALRRAEPEHLRWKAAAQLTMPTQIAVAWSPKWQLAVDGQPATLRPMPDNRMSFDLPAGRHRIALDFRLDGWDRLGIGITLATALAAVLAWRLSEEIRRRRPR